MDVFKSSFNVVLRKMGDALHMWYELEWLVTFTWLFLHYSLSSHLIGLLALFAPGIKVHFRWSNHNRIAFNHRAHCDRITETTFKYGQGQLFEVVFDIAISYFKNICGKSSFWLTRHPCCGLLCFFFILFYTVVLGSGHPIYWTISHELFHCTTHEISNFSP